MNDPNSNIDIESVIKAIKNNLVELHTNFDPSKLTQAERDEISIELGKVKSMTLQLKADLAKD